MRVNGVMRTRSCEQVAAAPEEARAKNSSQSIQDVRDAIAVPQISAHDTVSYRVKPNRTVGVDGTLPVPSAG
jgi:hypothetical protein